MDYNTQLKNQPSWLIDTDARYNSSLPNLCSQAVTQGKPLLLTRAAWTFIANFTCGAKHIEMLYGASIKPGVDGSSNPVNMNIAGSFNAPIVKVFDYSLGGTIKFTGHTPVVYPEWWGGGVNDATADTNAENYAIAAFNCGIIRHSPQGNYALGALSNLTCGVVEGNLAVIKPSTTGTVFTLENTSSPPSGFEQTQKPRITGFNWQTGTAAPTNLILNNTATDMEIDHNIFGVITATYLVHTKAYGGNIERNLFGSGNHVTASVYLDMALSSINAVNIVRNNFTQQTGECIKIDGGGDVIVEGNILQGCSAGGLEWTATANLQMKYQNYNEANTSFDIKFDTSASRAFIKIASSSFASSTCTSGSCIVMSTNTNLEIAYSIFDGECVDTSAIAISGTGSYRGIKNISFDSPSGCNTLTEATSALIANIPSHFEFIGNNDTYDPPLDLYVNRPPCNSAHKGYRIYISNGASDATWGSDLGSTGSTANALICNGTGWSVFAK